MNMDDMDHTNTESADLSKYRKQPWSNWFKTLDLNALSESNTESNSTERTSNDCRVTRLPREYMGLFGIFPAKDQFYAAVCSTCGAVIKPQSLRRHLELKHPGECEAETKSASAILLPPPQLPVKRNRSSSAKSKNKESTAVSATVSLPYLPTHSTTDSIVASSTLVDTSPLMSSSSSSSLLSSSTSSLSSASSSSSLSPSLAYEADRSSSAHSIRRKSPNTSTDRKAHKFRDKEHEIDKHTNNSNNDDDEKRVHAIANRQTNVKSQSTTKRVVSARSRDVKPVSYNKLVAQHRASKDQVNGTSTRSRSQSILKSVVRTSSPALPTPAQSHSGTDTEVSLSNSSVPSQDSVLATDIEQFSSTSLNGADSMRACAIISMGGVDSAMDTTDIAPTVTSANICDMTQSTDNLPVMRVVSVTSSYVYTMKLPDNSTILNSIETPSLPSVTPATATVPESLSMLTLPILKSQQPVTGVSSSHKVIESINVPVVMEVPTLPESVTNITVYTNYPKPLVVSAFSAKKLGHTLVFKNRRLDVIRREFNSILKNNRRAEKVALKTIQSSSSSSSSSSNTSSSTSMMFGMNSLNAMNSACRYPKTTVTVPVPNIQTASLLSHRPNILRTAASSKQSRDQHIPKILGTKRPAPSSSQISNLDCKHMLLKPAGIIGKMIVHQHEVMDTTDGPATNHLTLDKVVPVNIK